MPPRSKAAALACSGQNNHSRKVWLAASTHQGEDGILLAAFAQLKNLSRFITGVSAAPPRAFCQRNATMYRRRLYCVASQRTKTLAPETDIVVVTPWASCFAFNGAADIAFVGGSLVPVGGH